MLVSKITFGMVEIIFKEDVITSSVAKITYTVVKITFKLAVVTSSVAIITFVVNGTTFKVAVITFSVVDIICSVVGEINRCDDFFSGQVQFVCDQDHLCGGWDNF